ncbi:MAG: hypothetical protein CBB68_03600 [Rhodospirillaceae bacterium TMED8]|nr:hypothetical protein [Magnetovibrio sp.]OUT51967.1 MAG: hypothetical protein CBB68_03600 [Rhodospirillaceae bacterium TMED8]|tara:strand:+ start:2583 stop:2840 length:258 start_codon:yes stop_codon:yes gene_type:complete
MAEANTIFFRVIHQVSEASFKNVQNALQDNAKATNQSYNSKTAQGVFRIQNDLVKPSYQKAIIDGQRISEMTVKPTETAVAPIYE